MLLVNNNSTDDTAAVLQRLASQPGVPLEALLETKQGIVPARNRAVAECLSAEFMLVMDDDELPRPGWVQAAVRALRDQGFDCVGGRVHVRFDPAPRPEWLGDELLGFLAEVNYGDEPFEIRDDSTPVWTANVGYRTALFRDGLRFDMRYSRVGKAIGGGEDVVMFQRLLERKARIGYQPQMTVEHFVEPWRLHRRYFLRVHYAAGYKHGLHELAPYPRSLFGVPLFLFGQAAAHGLRSAKGWLTGEKGRLRQTMNFTHACGMIAGSNARWRNPENRE
jgi:glycosyltransferase involved in cell wall biosynthesis